ncbi:MAG: ATP-binding protein [Eubacteriales bacterium]
MDFITKWIHDVKVPIAAMHLILEQGHEGMEEQLDMQLTYIEQKTQTVLYHIKSNSFYDDFKIVEVKASRLIHAALKPFAVFFACKQLVLEMPDEDGTVLTDEKWSAYILSQLISNAVKYVPEKGKVSIGVKRDKSQTKVTIKNQGGGIKPQEIAHVFDKGYTSYYARADNKATGYGLYLAKKLADQLGHTLVCTSEYGDYTVFTLTFLRD